MSQNGGGDQLARGAKSATFKQAELKAGKNAHGQTWDDIFGAGKPKKKPRKKKALPNP
jgi:hypothetical protein